MTRTMIDTTHDGLAASIGVVKALNSKSDIVAAYDTGSTSIDWTPEDFAQLPAGMTVVTIDQGFIGSPNLKANIRDAENGAWTIPHAVNRSGWDVPRPTLYLGFPDTALMAFNAGWRGDVWLVAPSKTAPVAPPVVPAGLNVVAVQWNFAGSYDESVVFDPTWPAVAATPPTLLGIVSYIQEGFKANTNDFVSKRVVSTDAGKSWR